MDLVTGQTRRQLDSHLARLLSRMFRDSDGQGVAYLDSFSEAVRTFVQAGGKRLRPQLCIWTYLIGCDGQNGSIAGVRSRLDIAVDDIQPPSTLSPGVLDVACAWELFHAFLLSHDDIIDAAESRRGGLSLHRQLADLDGGSAAFGTHLAIVAGDLLFAATMKVLHDLDVPADIFRQVLRVFSSVACTTGFGQAADILHSHSPAGSDSPDAEEELLRDYLWKTAAYTFQGPMITGALLAGVGDGARAALSRFSVTLGQAYQLQNDLADLSREAHEGCDLVQGKRTITLLQARRGMDRHDRRRFDQRLAELATANGHAVALAESLRQEVLESGAVERTAELIGSLLADARTAADDPALTAALSTGLTGLLNSLEESYFSYDLAPAAGTAA